MLSDTPIIVSFLHYVEYLFSILSPCLKGIFAFQEPADRRWEGLFPSTMSA